MLYLQEEFLNDFQPCLPLEIFLELLVQFIKSEQCKILMTMGCLS